MNVDAEAPAARSDVDAFTVAIVALMSAKLYSMFHAAGGFSGIDGNPDVLRTAGLVGVASHVALTALLASLLHLTLSGRGARRWVALALNGATVAAAYLDLLHARYGGFHVSWVELGALGEGAMNLATAAVFVHARDLLLFADLPAGALLLLHGPPAAGLRVRRAWLLATIALCMAYFGLAVSYMARNQPSFRLWDVSELSSPTKRRKMTYPCAWALNAAMWALSGERYALVGPPSGLPEGGQPAAHRPGRSPGVVLLQIESLPAGAFEWDLAGQPVMPFLRELCRGGVYFPNALSPRTSGGSMDADLGVLTGFAPCPRDTAHDYSFPGRPFLPGILARRGYATSTWANYLGAFFSSRRNHTALGVAEYVDITSRRWSTLVRKCAMDAPGDREFLAALGDQVAAAPTQHLYFVSTTSSHLPYEENLDDTEIAAATGLPFGPGVSHRAFGTTLRYVDVALRGLFERLGPLVQRGDLVVALYGDHAPSLEPPLHLAPELGPWAAGLRHVPLLLLGTGLPPRTRPEVVGLTDLACTLCRLLAVPFARGELGGRDILAPTIEGPLVTPGAVFEGDRERPPSPAEQALLDYGYGRLGARR